VVNPGFESGSFSPWVIGGGAPTPQISTAQKHAGSFSALLGTASGNEPSGNSFVRQAVTIPSGATKATLTFWYRPASAEFFGNGDWQELQIQSASGGLLAQVFRTKSNSQTWTPVGFDLTPYRGQTIQLWFNVLENGSFGVTSMYVDDVAVTFN
jgi:hypothetical protein